MENSVGEKEESRRSALTMIPAGDEGRTEALASATGRVEMLLSEIGKPVGEDGLGEKIQNSAHHVVSVVTVKHPRRDIE